MLLFVHKSKLRICDAFKGRIVFRQIHIFQLLAIKINKEFRIYVSFADCASFPITS